MAVSNKKGVVFTIIILFVVFLDLLTKNYFSTTFSVGQTRPIIDGVFHFTYVQNTGASFGMLHGQNTLLLLVSLIVVFVLFYFYKKYSYVQSLFIALIIGGAIGNMIDRVVTGYVIDFLDFRLINFPVFNVADSSVCVGALGLIVLMIIDEVKEHKMKKKTKKVSE